MTPHKINLTIDRIVMDRRDFHADDLIAAIGAHVAEGIAQGDFSASEDAPFRTVRRLEPEPIKGRATADRIGAAVAQAALGTVKR